MGVEFTYRDLEAALSAVDNLASAVERLTSEVGELGTKVDELTKEITYEGTHKR